MCAIGLLVLLGFLVIVIGSMIRDACYNAHREETNAEAFTRILAGRKPRRW